MLLRRFTRSPFAFWFGVAGLVIVTWSVVAGTLGRAQAEADRFGSLRAAVVVTRSVEAGAVVSRSDVEVREVPAAFLPKASVPSVEEVAGRTAVAPLFTGQAVVREQLAPAGLKGVAALLPADTRAVAVPAGAGTPPLHRGDVVDVLATFDPSAAGVEDPTVAVATQALVVDVGADAASVAVSPEEAKRVAFAVTQGTVTLAISSPDQRTPVTSTIPTATPTTHR
jgi:Flp pilus assembly protein CpaB